MSALVIDPQKFADAVDARWKQFDSRNVSSQALRAVWAQIATTFNAQIISPSDRWPVIPAELGVGKTTCAKVYCSMLARDENHPGVLIVVRTIDQAKEYADEINAWSLPNTAFAYHSDLPAAERKDLKALAAYPVVVICHRAYEVGLDALAVSESYPRFDAVHAFRRGRRGLVIVDEALDQIHEARIKRGVIQQLLPQIPYKVDKAHPDAMDILEAVSRALRKAPGDRHRAFSAEDLLAGTSFTPEQADAKLLAMWEHGPNSLRHSNRIQPKVRVQIAQTLTALRRHLAAYRWTSGSGVRTVLSGNRLLLMPPGTHGVILDATGRLNNVYAGRPDQFEVRKMTPVRDYSAVTIFDARTGNTGKAAAERKGEELAKSTLDAVLARYGDQASNRRVLVVVAKVGEPAFVAAGATAGFKEFATAHWNKIDGRNDWREFDTLVIATLPYAAHSLDLNTYMAIHGAELDDEALNSPPDDVKIIRETRIAAQLAQAMGRIRLRAMTNEDGTCEPCDVFLRLPNWAYVVDADRILDAVRLTLPGAQVTPWDAASKKLPRAGKAPVLKAGVAAALLAYAVQMKPGAEAISDVRRRIQATAHGTWFRVQSAAVTPGDSLQVALAGLGVGIEPAIGRRPARIVRTRTTGTVNLSSLTGVSGTPTVRRAAKPGPP